MTLTARKKIFEHRFVIVTGKGGVGKSTLASAIALAAARQGRRTLLFQSGPAGHAGKSLVGGVDIGEELVELCPNLFAVRPSTASGMREYVLMRLHSERAYRLVFENPFTQKLLGGIPGVTELIWLGKAFNHERERRADGAPVWDTIVLDPPATGHSLYLFQVPYVVRDAVPTGPFHDEAVEMVRLLQDPTRTAMYLVTMPEEMPVNESIELREQIDRKMQIPIVGLFVNALFPRLFAPDEIARLHHVREAVPEDGGVIDRLVTAATFRIERRALQDRYLKKLDQRLGLPTLTIPYYFSPALEPSDVEDIARRIETFGDSDDVVAEPMQGHAPWV